MKKIKFKKEYFWALAILIVFLTASISYFYLPENKGVVFKSDKEDRECFFKEGNGAKRLIEFNKIKTNAIEKELVAGTDIFTDSNGVENKYDFGGLFEKDKIIVFGDIKGIQVEREYQVRDDGIIEGTVSEKGWLVNEVNGKKTAKIAEMEKVKFEEKYLIPKIDCADFDKK